MKLLSGAASVEAFFSPEFRMDVLSVQSQMPGHFVLMNES
jgi:hypothetical protein